MTEVSNVGSIYLDLIVKDTVQKQVAAIGANAKADAQQSFSGLEKVISDTVGKAVEKLSQSVQSAANQVEAAVKAVSTSAERATEKAAAEMSKASQAGISSVQSIQATVANIERTIAASATQASSKVSQVAQETEQKTGASMQTIIQKAQSMGATVENAIGVSFSRSVALAQARINTLERELDAVTGKLNVQWNSGTFDPGSKGTQALLAQQEKLFAQIETARERLAIEVKAAAQKQAAAEASAAQKSAQAAEAAAARQQDAVRQAHTAADPPALARVGPAFWNRLTVAAGGFRDVAVRAFSSAASAGGRLLGMLAGARKRFSGAGKAAHHFGVRLKGIISSALFFNLLSRGLTNMVKYMGTALGASEELQDALANLKGAAATAAAPLIDALVPAITALANGAATAMSYLSRLISNLTGKSVASMSSAAKKIQKTADAAKKATAGFDEIEKLGDSNSKAKEPNYDFQGQSSMLDSVLQAVQNGDWGQIGQILAQKVNGIVKSVDWAALGEKVANALVAIPEMAIGFILGTDWAKVGQSISDGLISALNGITDWIQSVDWAAVGNKIKTFLKNVDWKGIARSAFKLLGSAIGAAAKLLWGVIDESVADIKDYFTQKIEECGGNVAAGLLKGILDGLANIGHWIWENICIPIVDGIKDVFGIHSPSTVMAELGGFLVAGLLNGITGAWNRISTFCSDAMTSVVDSFKNGWGTVAGWFKKNVTEPIGNFFKNMVNGITGFINGMMSAVTDGINFVIRSLNKLSFDVPDWVPGIGGETWGFNIREVTPPQIPMLANGGVIKQPTLAMMGEYAGAGSNPEIVAPQSVIAETVASVMEDMAASNIAGFEAVVSILREIQEAILGIEIGDDVIGQAVARYNRKMAIARGGA